MTNKETQPNVERSINSVYICVEAQKDDKQLAWDIQDLRAIFYGVKVPILPRRNQRTANVKLDSRAEQTGSIVFEDGEQFWAKPGHEKLHPSEQLIVSRYAARMGTIDPHTEIVSIRTTATVELERDDPAMAGRVPSQLATEELICGLRVEPRLTVLVCVADILSVRPYLHLDQELKLILDRVTSGPYKEPRVQCFSQLSANLDDLRRSLIDRKPKLVHLCGHGTPDGPMLDLPPIQPDQIANVFKNSGKSIRCVVLNFCYSEKVAELLKEHVAWVVGYPGEFSDAAALAFARVFYEAIGTNLCVEMAHALGRGAATEKTDDGDSLPELYPGAHANECRLGLFSTL